MYGNDRGALRDVFFQAWARYRAGEQIAGVDRRIVAVALMHPEYHALLDDPERSRERDYTPGMGGTNPFLHMAMHVDLSEQVALDRPSGVLRHHLSLLNNLNDEHAAQHEMMDCLGEVLWRAGRESAAPDTQAYLDCLAEKVRKHQPR